MRNAAECAKRLLSLLKSLPAPREGVPQDGLVPQDPIGVLVMSFLLWECSTDKAQAACKQLAARTVDFNDLRVCMPQEMLEFLGFRGRYPRGPERCQRLRAVLRDVYRREHAVQLDALAHTGKREIRRYLESLDGMVPYVASRVALLSFDAHAIPVDEQLRSRLVEVGAADDSIGLLELGSWLEHHIKASTGAAAHAALQAWVDRGGGAAKVRVRRSKSISAGAGSSRGTTKTKTRRPVTRT